MKTYLFISTNYIYVCILIHNICCFHVVKNLFEYFHFSCEEKIISSQFYYKPFINIFNDGKYSRQANHES